MCLDAALLNLIIAAHLHRLSVLIVMPQRSSNLIFFFAMKRNAMSLRFLEKNKHFLLPHAGDICGNRNSMESLLTVLINAWPEGRVMFTSAKPQHEFLARKNGFGRQFGS
jgi:hypothetical protein